MGFLADKKILITGLLSKHSIAHGIAKACHREAPSSPSLTRPSASKTASRNSPPNSAAI